MNEFEVSHSLKLDRAARTHRIAGVCDEYRKGVPIAEIANKYGIALATVIKYARTAGLTRNRKIQSKRDEVCERYKKGELLSEITRVTGIDRKAIWSMVTKAGIPLRKGTGYAKD